MKQSLALVIVAVALVACGDAQVVPFRDGGMDTDDDGGGGPGDRDAGADTDGGLPAQVLRNRTAAMVTAPPRYALVGETYRYRPKANVSVHQLSVSEGPPNLALRAGVLEWQPAEGQAGSHRVVLAGSTSGGSMQQSFDIAVATSTLRVAGDVSVSEGGRVFATNVGRQQLAGVGVSVPGGAVQSNIQVSVSEMALAPNLPNTAGTVRALRFGPAGTVFDTPAQVFLPIPDGVAVSRARLGAYVYDNNSGRWVRVQTLAVDTDNHVLAARAQHFSVYAVAQASIELKPELARAAETSTCAGTLIGRCTLRDPPSAIQLASVNNLPDSLRALLSAEDASVQDLLSLAELRGSLRIVRVFELREVGSAFITEEAVSVTTLYAAGDGNLTVSHTDALGNQLARAVFPLATLTVEQLLPHFSGAATAVRFATPAADDSSLSARVHLAYAPGDASLEPVDPRDLGPAAVDAEAVALAAARADDDRDCDGLRDAFDLTDDSLAPTLEVSPRQVVSAFPDELVNLRAQLLHAQGSGEWRVLDGSDARLTEVAGLSNGRAFSASAAGRYLVEFRASSDGRVLEHVFAIDVVPAPLLNTPPICRPTKTLRAARVGEPVALGAIASDAESPPGTLRIEWGLYDAPTDALVTSPWISVAGDGARLMPMSAGKYVIGCRAFDGQLRGGVGTLEIVVDEAAKNRAPELTVSPLEASVTPGQALTLHAFARDPDGDALAFTWRAEGQVVPASNGGPQESHLVRTPDKVGSHTISVAVKDAASTVEATVTITVREPTAQPIDADADGFFTSGTAQLDCDDTKASVHPGAAEQCNAVDDDCDVQVDEGSVCTSGCAAGFQTDGAGGCVDVDECAVSNGGCDLLATCVNTPGSFSCGKCPAGYEGNGITGCTDINECSVGNGGCDPLSPCTNTPGSFRCGDCPAGYTGGGATACTDIDECAVNSGGCDPRVVCVNTPGSRACTSCPAGYVGTGESGCTDINECAANNGGCDPRTTCTNTAGGRTCGSCPSGYAGSGESGCVDIDECMSGSGRCDPLATCMNAPGGFSCSACPAGYLGSGATGCIDVDECATNNGGCDPRVACTNEPGTFRCGACPYGFSGSGQSGCIDIDECAANNGGCDPLAECVNMVGSYRCGNCPAGYSGGASGCVDIDECAVNNGGCDPLRTCFNSPGSSSCGQCQAGYEESGLTSCRDIDECLSTSACGSGQICRNSLGGFTCECPTGFFWDGTVCQDIDECQKAPCKGNAVCQNLVGSHQCVCPPGTFDETGDTSLCSVALSIASGNNATCAITDAKSLFCWGDLYGDTPAKVGTKKFGDPSGDLGETDWANVDTSSHTCAIRAGLLYCWGPGDYGKLGIGSSEFKYVPTLVGKDGDWISVSVGADHTCGVRSNGTVSCWGSNRFGQIGADLKIASASSPLALGSATDWTFLNAGVYHGCGLRLMRLQHVAMCWGYNGAGGTGTQSRIGLPEQPVPSTVELTGDFSSIAAGYEHTCAVSDGALYCWGGNVRGQAGVGTDLAQVAVTRVGKALGWSQVSAAMWTSCGIADGALYCWGDLGDLTVSREPVLVGKDADWTAVASGYQHHCGIRKQRVYCWGRNKLGQLGNGTDKDSADPLPIAPGRAR